MHIIRRKAKQGYEIPTHSHKPTGPFPPELFRRSPIQYPDNSPSAGQGELYSCRECGAHLYEYELADHRCEDEETS